MEKRQLYKKYKFHSIFEFAAKIAGMNRETVVEILRVYRKLEDKPLLQAQMSEYGWTKLKVVAPIATKENEKLLAEKVKDMSKTALVTFVNEIKKQNSPLVQSRPGADTETLLSQSPQRISVRFPLEPEVELRFRELQKKLSKEKKAPVDFNEVLKTLLDAYDEKTRKSAARKLPPPAKSLEEAEKEARKKAEEVTVSRYIPVKIKDFLSAKYGGRCAYPGCMKLPEINHHTRRFAINSSHDPDFLAPLCKGHERLAHHGLIGNEEKSPEEWFVKMEREKTGPKYEIDRKVNSYRQ